LHRLISDKKRPHHATVGCNFQYFLLLLAFSGWKGNPSPSEVSNIIAMAKQASANVLIAQQQVQAARDNVLNQQRMAAEKEAQAQILTQKSEAAAAIQRSEGEWKIFDSEGLLTIINVFSLCSR
jgi:hypothetical protein